ncbi:hypothetical protein RCH09_001289 [Actimicrobium sp. GrIS 1.19]|uniref:hypothetical protein n=1 Tax=Actimicrobium sp. GrIS 1.19 TaxID=3071708 RepID=UPI002E0BBF17|nr:hypothetical protein [Actimicrobium sp. GrIS 1.19]
MTLHKSRRTFLKAGLVGAIVLSAAGALYRLNIPKPPPGKFALDSATAAALSAIVLVILDGAIPPTPAAATQASARVCDAIAGLPLSTQKEIQDLFGLLTLGVTRRLLAGVPDQWQDAKPADVAAFLQSWRTHRIGMLQSAYAALHDLILGSWYTNEASWSAIGYPGPRKELS